MEILYNDEQKATLAKRMSIISTLKTSMIIAVIFFLLILTGGGTLIYFNYTFLGIVVCLFGILPFIVSILFCTYTFSITKCIKKGNYSVVKVKVAESKAVQGTPYWHTVTPEDGGVVYYYTETPLKEVKAGDELDSIICHSKHLIIFAVDPI
jgi:hypothetical protein